jgi:hypothetical protein
MMKDPRYKDTEAWVDALALRIRRLQHLKPQIESAIEACESERQGSETTNAAGRPHNIKFSRASETNLQTIRSLPPAANILLFTPVIIPAGQKLETYLECESETMDPFEHFGKALSYYHSKIRHVPYVAKVGFTETHHAFVSEADAVVTVVCEPAGPIDKYHSVSYQMDFAEAALDSLESKTANAADALVLIQCGANEYRSPVCPTFMNVIECKAYNAKIAQSIAQTIFSSNI